MLARLSPRRSSNVPASPPGGSGGSTIGTIPNASRTSAAAVTGVAPSRSSAFEPAERQT